MQIDAHLSTLDNHQVTSADSQATINMDKLRTAVNEIYNGGAGTTGKTMADLPGAFPSQENLISGLSFHHPHGAILAKPEGQNLDGILPPSCLDTSHQNSADTTLADGSHVRRDADKDVVTRPDGSRVEIGADGPTFYDRDGKPIQMEPSNPKFAGSGMKTDSGATVSGYYFQKFGGDGTITFPDGKKIEIQNNRVVTAQFRET